MEMFKYIVEILKQFTHAQKTIALLMLLMSIIMLSLGPKLIDAMSVDNTEYKSKVNRQSTEIENLRMTVDSLDTRIRNGQRKCTNEIAQRETEFIAMLDELKGDMNRTSSVSKTERKKLTVFPKTNEYEMVGKDTVIISRTMVDHEMIQKTQTSKDSKVDLKKIVNKIESMKEKIKN